MNATLKTLKTLRSFDDFCVLTTEPDKRVVGFNRTLEAYDRIMTVYADARMWTRGPWIDKAQGIDGYFYAD